MMWAFMPASANWIRELFDEQGTPRRGRLGDVDFSIAERREIEIGKDDVERGEESAVVERCTGDLGPDAERDAEVQTVEPLHSVGIGQVIVDRLHDRDDIVDRFRRQGSEDAAERHDGCLLLEKSLIEEQVSIAHRFRFDP